MQIPPKVIEFSREITPAAAFIDISRAADGLDGLADWSTHHVKGGRLGNLGKFTGFEQKVLHEFVLGTRQFPEALTGVSDDARRAADELFVSASVKIDSAIEAIQHAPKTKQSVMDKLLKKLLGSRRDPSAAEQHLRSAADDIRAGHKLIGGKRALPELEMGPVHEKKFVPADDSRVVGEGHRTVQKVVQGLYKYGLGAMLGVKSIGADNVPHEGALLLLPTHGAFPDPFVNIAGVKRPVRFMGTDAYLKGWVRKITDKLGAYPVSKGSDKVEEALEMTRGLLRDKQIASPFPEGALNRHGGIGPHADGPATLALETGSPWLMSAQYGLKPKKLRGEPTMLRPISTTVFGEARSAKGAKVSRNNIVLVREMMQREQAELMPIAKADYEARRAASLMRRPLIAEGAVVATAGYVALKHND